MVKDGIWIARGYRGYTRIRLRFRIYFEKAGIIGYGTFHRFRHTFGSMLGEAGRSSFELKQLLGHASAATSEIYTVIGSDVLRAAFENLGEDIRTQFGRSLRPKVLEKGQV